MGSQQAFAIEGRAALVISECQRGVIEPGLAVFPGLAEQVVARGIVARIAELAQGFRQAGFPVIHATAAHRPDFLDVKPNTLVDALVRKRRTMVAGTPDVEIVAELTPRPEDIVMERSSGLIPFLGTPLDSMLRRMAIETVAIVGVSTNLAVTGSAFAAAEMGYRVVIPEDCIAGADPEIHRAIVDGQLRMLARIVSAQDVLEALR
jgi:nicotinamidase-related amidase